MTALSKREQMVGIHAAKQLAEIFKSPEWGEVKIESIKKVLGDCKSIQSLFVSEEFSKEIVRQVQKTMEQSVSTDPVSVVVKGAKDFFRAIDYISDVRVKDSQMQSFMKGAQQLFPHLFTEEHNVVVPNTKTAFEIMRGLQQVFGDTFKESNTDQKSIMKMIIGMNFFEPGKYFGPFTKTSEVLKACAELGDCKDAEGIWKSREFAKEVIQYAEKSMRIENVLKSDEEAFVEGAKIFFVACANIKNKGLQEQHSEEFMAVGKRLFPRLFADIKGASILRAEVAQAIGNVVLKATDRFDANRLIELISSSNRFDKDTFYGTVFPPGQSLGFQDSIDQAFVLAVKNKDAKRIEMVRELEPTSTALLFQSAKDAVDAEKVSRKLHKAIA